MKVNTENYFSAARALYWFCSDWHAGQSSELYSILSARLEYTPGMGETRPTMDDEEDPEAYGFYEALDTLARTDYAQAVKSALTLLDDIQSSYALAHD